jgi:hypothetical protein
MFVAAFLAALTSYSFTGIDARAQSSGVGTASQAPGQSIKLAQSYLYPYYPQVKRKKRRYRRRRYRATTVKKCASPWTYSRGLQRCICVAEGYGVSSGQCVKIAETCQKNAQWSETDQKCQCQTGFVENGSRCVDPNADVVTNDPDEGAQCLWPRVKSGDGNICDCSIGYREEAGQCIRDDNPVQGVRRRAQTNELLTNDVAIVQKCLKEAGYLRTNVRNSMGRKAWTAYWFFKQDYAIGRTPKGVYEAKAQHRLFTLCPNVSKQLAALPATNGRPLPGPGSGAPLPAGSLPNPNLSNAPSEQKQASLPSPSASEIKPAPEVKAPVKRVYARPEAGCLPGDLHKLIVGTYGARSELKKCTQTCIAMPASITKREMEEYESKRGIRWCRNCIEIGSQLPLDDILRIERGANVQVCTRPPSRLPKWKSRTTSKRPSYTKVRALYRQFPRGVGHEKDIAVVIGNGSYAKGLPVNASSYANAGAFHALLTEHLGFEQENIIDLRDASAKDLTRVFGTSEDHMGDLFKLLKGDAKSRRVVIYYAGHAGTKEDRTDSYLMPVDAIKYREERSGYAMSLLYANLEKLGVKSVLLLLEAGFGRDLSDYLFPPNLPELQVKALPKKPRRWLTVLTASDGDQKTLDDPKFGFGLFTRYLIEGMAGRADLAPIGNGDRKIDAVELYSYTSHMVRLTARKSFGLLQKPVFSKSGNLRISIVQAHGQ